MGRTGLRARLRDPALRRATVDSLIALGLVLVVGLMSAGVALQAAAGPSAVVVAAVVIAMPAALAWRRTHPVASAVTVYLCALLHLVLGVVAFSSDQMVIVPTDVLVLVALYSVTVYGPPWARRAALAGALLGALLLAVVTATWFGGASLWNFLATLLGVAGMVLATWGYAQFRRGRIERLESLLERARRLEIERDQQAQLATAAERARIAREMHDVVAHTLSVVIAQADGGRYAARTDPVAAERALTTIAEMGRDALADIRRILGVLRDGDAQAGTALLPQPVDADLDALVGQIRTSGVAVSLVRMGEARPLPPGAGLTIYRVCQEALTNALKHAGPGARITVLLQWLPGALTLQVDDDGRGAAAPSDGKGQGLVGMRERAALFGGTVQAGPRPGGGYRVRVQLPLPELGAASAVPAPLSPPTQGAR
ncbi:sensor histidine kinase [Georgenia thermotolerans]|uniref:histidine kinase n=1 Tax=Georgenia thermotolerans TaxID=527326 RepID=A0A7J5UN64_9MICO|nr:sensor histidine kinase [Georgenia thermotolerans]KAE8763710.1 sensor histidine kinase [Georgenia thermotolerans]